MTNEEAIITLTNILIDDYGCGLERRDYDSMRHAVKVMENAEKYRWHDLRKNPDDMPEIGLPVIVCDIQKRVCIRTLVSKRERYRWSQDKYDVIAWRYIEPFEV